MSEDQPFLRAILAAPEDAATRRLYADWLEERGDPRAEYLRLAAQLAAAPVGYQAAPGIRRRMIQLRTQLPAPWLAILGDYRSSAPDPDHARVELAAAVLGRPTRYLDEEGFESVILAAATQPLTDALAYVECREWTGDILQAPGQWWKDAYQLRIQDGSGRKAAWRLQWHGDGTYPCEVGFLEWYGNVALMIYGEKHGIRVCRFGLDSPAEVKKIGRYGACWVVDGPHLGIRSYLETCVRRLAIPGLQELPPLSAEQAAEWELLPA
jgi:uncharacterized protein (TIGR02996 family)